MPETLIKVDLTQSAYDNDMVHNRWHPDIPMVATVKPGADFIVETYDWTGGFIKNNDSADDVRDIDLSIVHFLSGPIGVEGAEPGDLLIVDILDVGTARLSWRRLWSLLSLLPPDSLYAQATVGEQATWSINDHLVATVVDALQVSNWLFASAHSKQKVPMPQRVPRPGVTADRAATGTKHTQAQMRNILDTWGQRAGDEFTSETVG